ncbi:MAG TPA: response regulator [Sandaracinaceae bacterium LLY-WYZ-13_1]|nr:response regulator [Sandaracinaceae bacterium LLY-WYZ-13_1]
MSQRVLVVDDSATVRRVVGRTLSQAGYQVSLAVDGREGLEAAQREVPDLVLVDFVMPMMNGLKFVQALRQVANLAEVPVVLMSAKADKIGAGFVAQTGALDAITKPFSPEALLAVTGHALSRWAHARAEDTEPPPAGERASIPPMFDDSGVEEAPAASSPEKLAEAARAIGDRLGHTLTASGMDGARIRATLLETMEPETLFALVDELAALVPGREGEVALRGRLEHVALGDVLQMLQHQRQTGVLEIEKQPSRSGRRVTVSLRDGAVQLALGRVQEQEFRLGRYVLREGLIEREDLDRILERQDPARGLLGTQLVKLGYLSSEELRRVLMQQTSELIYEALRWPSGRYRFVRFASLPQAEDAQLGLPLASILMEGLRRVDEWRLIEEQIRSFEAVPRRDEEALRTFDASRLRPEERRVLDAVDGARTVREIVDAARMSRFDVCKILFQLLTSRLLRI